MIYIIIVGILSYLIELDKKYLHKGAGERQDSKLALHTVDPASTQESTTRGQS